VELEGSRKNSYECNIPKSERGFMAEKKLAKPQSAKKTVKSASAKAVRKPVQKPTKKAPIKNMVSSSLVGKAAPAFQMLATGGRMISLSDFKGKTVVLYFYPRDATPGCTVEGHDFSRLYESFRKSGAEVFGVSRDSLSSHEKFKAGQKYKIDLLSDTDEAACQKFAVIKMKNMYGKKVRGIERSTFVIDGEGKIVKEWRGVKVPGHAEEVLEFVKTL
jgi:peroxiredoxin Q/BCP